jgi:DNA polymerase elongation subunit (family B)
MSYVDAYYDKQKNKVNVVERIDGKRKYVEHPARYYFYAEDPKGKYKSIYGDSVSKITCSTHKDFQKNIAFNRGKKLFESDLRPINRVISDHYQGVEAPKLHTAFFDIEVDFDPERGYSSPQDAFMPITAVAVVLNWCDAIVCLAVAPKTLDSEQANKIADKVGNTIICKDEKELLQKFLVLIEDADILSGWNSEGYDIPYTINRIIKVLGKSETRKMCLWDMLPKERKYINHGRETETYDLIGRVHLDYLELYRKYNYEERHSYRLDFIGEMEVDEKKVPYEGSLDRLYNHDFELFLEYNIQDTMLLKKIDDKLQFIDLANTIAHDNTVLLPTTMGAVATTEQAIINEAHRRGMVVPDRIRERQENTQAAGAFVAFPQKGLHDWVGSMDLNSLYPSVFRALNMAPETVVGQLRPVHTEKEINDKIMIEGKSFADAWLGKFGSNEYELVMQKDVTRPIIIDMEDGSSSEVTGADVYNLVFNSNQPWCLSANGTLFRTDVQGIVPGLLERWYSERQDLQAKKKEQTDPEQIAFYDKRQLVKKINLNSLYGAILNAGCRFFDMRIGQSTTLTGRRITRHMGAETNRLLTGEYNHQGKTIIYGDTDSVYFSAAPALPEGTQMDLEMATELYDSVSDTVSKSFPNFMKNDFNVPLHQGEVIKAGREVVGRAGLFITKKRYAINVLDLEGWKPEGGKLKIMGLDIKRSDTPEFVQDFLEDILAKTLDGGDEKTIMGHIRIFKEGFKGMDPWSKGMPKRVNNLTTYTEVYNKTVQTPGNSQSLFRLEALKEDGKKKKKATIPGHVRASINWNNMLLANSDNYSMKITDGMKVVVCQLKSNNMGFSSIAYPTDELQLPDWFKKLPFDEDEMEKKVVDKKVHNLLNVLKWDFSQMQTSNTFHDLFSFSD